MAKPVRDRILYAIKSSGPQSAPDIAAKLDVTPQAVQQHLAKLQQSDFVAWEDRRQPRGRPRRYWTLTEKGHGRFPDRHGDLTIDILRSVERVFGTQGLDRLISQRESDTLSQYHEQMVGCISVGQRVERLTAIRLQEGYMAECEELADGSYRLIENHCPVCAAASVCQGICRSELRLFQEVLGDAVTVERTDHILASARRCAYIIKPR